MSEYIKQHFYNEVIPDYLEYVEVRKLRKALDDRRKAMHAASVIEHFREILPAPFNDKNSIDKLCPGYHILVEAVNAFKHHDRRGRKNSMISQSMQIKMVFVDTIFHDALGEYINSEKEVLFYFDNGMVHNAYHIMTGVLNFWIAYLYKMNVIDESFYFDTQQTLYVPRHLAREHSFDMGTIIPNVPIEFEIINQRYNYVLNQVLPIGPDESRITGMKIIYK